MSFGTGAIRSCESITVTGGYPAADRFFLKSKAPRSKFWSDDERPLDKVSTHHYRIVQGPNADYYDVTLYKTPMLRLFRPAEDGTSEMHLRAHRSSASNMFMWQVCGFNYAPLYTTTTGDDVCVPLACEPKYHANMVGEVPEGFSAKLVFNADKQLITERSAHYLAYVRVMSEDTKNERTELRGKLTPFIDLLMLRLSYFHSNTPTMKSWRAGRPFKAAQYDALPSDNTLRYGEVGDKEFQAMERLAQQVYNQMMASQDYRDDDAETPIKLPNFRANYTKVLLEKLGMDAKKGRRPLGAFPAKVPGVYCFS